MGDKSFDIHDAQAFKLQQLSALKFNLDDAVAQDMSSTENAIWELNRQEFALDKDVLADAMLNIEALASVRMDGRPPSAHDMMIERAYAAVRAQEAPEYVQRYERDRESLAVTLDRARKSCTVGMLKDIHSCVLPLKHKDKGGVFRTDLKQVGGSRYHVFGDPYRMPAPEDIGELMDDLAAFMNADELLVLEVAGLAHAQVININPFDRGNGKMGRVAIHYVLRNRGVAPAMILPFTPTIVTSNHDYVAGIRSCAVEPDMPVEEVSKRLNGWLRYFSGNCDKAVNIAADFAFTCSSLVEKYRDNLGVRSDNTAVALLGALAALPTFSAQMAADYLGCSFKRASEACKLLLEKGVITQVTQGKRNRVYCADEFMAAYMQIDALR